MTDIDEIRKKHERRYKVFEVDQSSYADHLTMRDVDALFAALDELQGFYDLTLEQAQGWQGKSFKLQKALDEAQGRIYPCADCGKLRTKDEGGTTFILCDECWDKHFDKKRNR